MLQGAECDVVGRNLRVRLAICPEAQSALEEMQADVSICVCVHSFNVLPRLVGYEQNWADHEDLAEAERLSHGLGQLEPYPNR